MFIVESYFLSVVFCVVTMLCWGSWANTQKMVQREWRFELFYWDYVLGILMLSLIGAFTLGSFGEVGRPFLKDLHQASLSNVGSAFLGGVLFNLANILLTAAIAGAGMAVAFPVGIGIALIVGVVVNYLLYNKGNPYYLFAGIVLVSLAIILNSVAYQLHTKIAKREGTNKWIIVSIVAGLLMSSFYPFVASGMDLQDFIEPQLGKMTPYTAFVLFAVGVFISNILFNSLLMRSPIHGAPIKYKEYFSGRLGIHLVGVLGGIIWGIGNLFSLIAAGKAGPAISYGLGQGATLVAALWGVLVWKEFKGASKSVNLLIIGMFFFFLIGLGLVVFSGA